MGPTAADVTLALTGEPSRVITWAAKHHLVGAGAVSRFLDLQSYSAARHVVVSIDPMVHCYLAIIRSYDHDAHAHLAPLFHVNVANVAFEPWTATASSATAGLVTGLTAYLRDVWLRERIAQSASSDHPVIRAQRIPLGAQVRQVSLTEEGATNLVSAALDGWIDEAQETATLQKLERVRTLLGLRPSELARLLGVSREGLRQWEAGASVSLERVPEIDDLYLLAVWFANHIKPEALPAFIRRQIPALQYQSPLDWLAGRRHAELRKIFERGFAPEVTR